MKFGLGPYLTAKIEYLLLSLEGKWLFLSFYKFWLDILKQHDEMTVFENGTIV